MGGYAFLTSCQPKLQITVLVKVKSLSCVRLFVTPRTVAHQAPPSMGFFQARMLEWVAISPEDLPDSGIEPRFPAL